MKMFSIKQLTSLLALATVATSAIACTSTSSQASSASTTDTAADVAGAETAAETATGADATTGDTTGGGTDAAATDTAATDAAATDAAATDAAAASGKGCTSAADQTFLATLGKDKAAADKFGTDVTNCTLANVGKPDEASATAAIGKCLVDDKKQGVSLACGACYGVRGYCTFVNCVKNQEESAKANCVAASTGEPCTACATKYNCLTKAADCQAGK